MAKTGLKGKGLKLLHCYTDHLWGLGDKSVPDPGFTPQRVFPQVLTTGLTLNQGTSCRWTYGCCRVFTSVCNSW